MSQDTHQTTTFDPTTVPLAGTQLIEASAGTGKTYTLASLYLRLILAGYKVDQILVVTFTEAATAELRDRIRARLREALAAVTNGESSDPFLGRLFQSMENNPRLWDWRLRVALSGFDEAAIFTIHAFCRRELLENAFESNIIFDPELVTDSGPLYEEIVSDFWAIETYDAPAWVVRFLERNNISPGSLIPLVKLTAAQPDRHIVPPHASEPVAEGLNSLYQAAREIWRTRKDEIVKILETHSGINRRSYSKKNLPRWLGKVQAYFESDDILWPGPDTDIDKFAQSRLTEKTPPKKTAPEHPFFGACQNLWSFPERWLLAFKFRLIDYAREELRIRKTEQSIQFFDDLIHQLKAAVTGPESEHLARRIRERYTAALIDEFQDTDQAQYTIFNRIYAGTEAPFFLIGDPKQSIYAFRGADIFAYLGAVRDARERTNSLAVNWRSDPNLLTAVNTLFSRVDHPFMYADIAFSRVQPRKGARDRFHCDGEPVTPMRVLFVPRNSMNYPEDNVINKTDFNRRIPPLVASDISRLLSGNTLIGEEMEEKIHPGHIAVLVRTNLQARQAQIALRQLGIPSVLASAESVFQSNEALELMRVLRAVAEPGDTFRIKAALSTDLLGLTGHELRRLAEDDRQWEHWTHCFRNWHQLWQSGLFIHMLQDIFSLRPQERSRQPLLTALLELTDGERRVTNIQHLAELLHEAVRQHHLGIQGLLRWFGRQLIDIKLSSEAVELRLESDARAVKLITIHKSKGLEYPVVYVPYAWQGTPQRKPAPPVSFHDPENDFSPVCDLGSEQLAENTRLAWEEETAENMRLLYVALTRARHQCTVIWAGVKDAYFSPLGRLLYFRDDGIEPAEAGKAAANMSDEEIRAILAKLSQESGDAIAVETVPVSSGVQIKLQHPEPATLIRRTRHRELKRKWRQVSFSGLVSEGTDIGPDPDRGRDHDVTVTKPVPALAPETKLSPANERKIILHDFDRGPRAGNFFHAIYEELDFLRHTPQDMAECIAQKLTAFGYEPRHWTDTVGKAVSQTLACPLDADSPDLKLGRIPMSQRFNELEFVFPVARQFSVPRAPVPAAELAQILSTANLPAGYKKKLQQLAFAPIKGFMKGFIDLIFAHEDKWYIIDYKSNFLGERYGDYSPALLEGAMAGHHYYLQYHIYAVALHRYLGHRLPGYDYDRHFGGVYYLFIRGMSPGLGAGYGIYRDRPDRNVIEGLSKLFEGE